MLNSLAAFFNGVSLEEMLLQNKKTNAKGIIYRDELSKKQSKPKKGNYSSSFEISEPLIKKGEKITITTTTTSRRESSEEEKGVMRVKVTMTKQEAARLLARCKEGGVLEFKDVAREIVQIPVNRVSIVDSLPPTSTCGGKVLQSIPEEC